MDQLIKEGLHLPRTIEMMEYPLIAPEQIRYAPLLPDGDVDMEAWRIMRKECIGASDLPTLMGTEKGSRNSEYALFQAMKGRYEKFFDNEDALLFGHAAEKGADHVFKKKTSGMILTDPNGAGIRWAGNDRFVASIDRLLFLENEEPSGYPIEHSLVDITRTQFWIPCEIKNVGHWMAGEWGTAFMPENYYDQVQGQILASGRDRSIVVAIMGGNSWNVYTVFRDESRIGPAKKAIARFLHRLDVNDSPEPDGTTASTDAVKEVMAAGVKGVKIEANSEIIHAAISYLEAVKDEEEAEKQQARNQNLIRLAMGEAVKCEHPMFVITFGPVNNKREVLNTETADLDMAVIVARAKVERATAALTAASKELQSVLDLHTMKTTETTRKLSIQEPKEKKSK